MCLRNGKAAREVRGTGGGVRLGSRGGQNVQGLAGRRGVFVFSERGGCLGKVLGRGGTDLTWVACDPSAVCGAWTGW